MWKRGARGLILAVVTLEAFAPRALAAQHCATAAEVEGILSTSPSQPFLPPIKALSDNAAWLVATSGGFSVVLRNVRGGTVEHLTGMLAQADTTCGLRIGWRPHWRDGKLISADAFSVTTTASPSGDDIARLGGVAFSLSPGADQRSTVLTIDDAGIRRTAFSTAFRATAISVTPEVDGKAVRIELIGSEEGARLNYAEFWAERKVGPELTP